MRSLPYKNVISSCTVYNKSQVLTATILKARLEENGQDLSFAKKGSLKVEFLSCVDNPAFPGRRKLMVDTKIETYITDSVIFEILHNRTTVLEFKNYFQELIKFEVTKEGFEWRMQKKEDKRIITLTSVEKATLDRFLEVRNT